MFGKKYQRYDDGRFDLAQTSNLDRNRYAVEFDKQLTGPKIDYRRFGDASKSSEPVSSNRQPMCAVNPYNPLRLEFMGPQRRERVQKREEHKQANVELHRIRKHFDKRDLRESEKRKLQEEAKGKKEKRLSPILFEANFPDVCPMSSSSESEIKASKSEQTPAFPKAIVRTLDKPKIRSALEKEQAIRVARIQQQLKDCHEKFKAREAEQILQDKEKQAKIDYQVTDDDYRIFFEGNDCKYVSNGGAGNYPQRTRKTYPNTLPEIPYHLRMLNRERRQRRDTARLKEKILCSLGAPRKLPDTQLAVDSESDSAEYLSRQSTDSNDGMSLGPKTSSQFLIRSFKDPMAANPRGLPTPKVERVRYSTAMTWNDWFRSTVQSWRQSFKHNVDFHSNTDRVGSENFQIVEHDASKFIPIERGKMGSYDSVAEMQLIDETLDTAIKICRVPPQQKIEPNVHEPKSKFFKALRLRRHHAKWDLTHSQRPRARYEFRDPLGEKGAKVEEIPCEAGGKKELFTVAYTHKTYSMEQIEEARRLTIVEATDQESSKSISVASIVQQCERISSVTLPADFLQTGYTKEQQAIIDQTKQEVASIASCCSSESKSVSLVDFSNDSGSLVLHADGRLIPAHTMIHNWQETNNEVMLEPFVESEEPDPRGPPGSMVLLRRLAPKDRYPKVESKALKPKVPKTNAKKILRFMDDGDEYFIKEIKNRPNVETFKRREYISKLQGNLRNQLTAKWRLENLRLAEIRDLEEAKLARELEEFAQACPPILATFQEEFFQRAQVQLEQVRPEHQKTVELQTEYKEWESKLVRLNQDIIQLAHDWILCLKCQNFMYMLMPVEWRQVHAWMHKHADGTLFSIEETIIDRKERVTPPSYESGQVIMNFFNDYFAPRADPPIFVFTDHRQVMRALHHRQDQSLRQMLESRGYLDLLMDARTDFEEAQEGVNSYLDRARMTENKTKKMLEIMERKALAAEERANYFLDKKLPAAVYWKKPWRLRAAIITLKKAFHPGTELKVSLLDKYQLYCIQQIVEDCYSSLESIPNTMATQISKRLHWKRKLELHEAAKAQTENKRKEIAIYRLERSMDPPFKKPMRMGKLPRYYIRKPRVQTPPPTEMTLRQKILYAAFTEEVDAALTMKDPILDAKKLAVLQELENYCQDSDIESESDDSDDEYDPNAKIVTQVEARDGPEEHYVKRKDVLPSVYKFMHIWEQRRESLKKLELKKKAEAKKKKVQRLNARVS